MLTCTTPQVFSYDSPAPPTPFRPGPANRPAAAGGDAPPAGLRLAAAAAGLSTRDASPALRAGRTAAEATAWASDTALAARRAAAAGGGASLAVVLTVGLRGGSAPPPGGLSADAPAPRAAPAGANAAPAAPAALALLAAAGLGPFAPSAAGRPARTAAEATAWVSDTAALCAPAAGAGARAGLAVTAGARAGSLSEAVSRDAPSASSVGRANGPAAGGAAPLRLAGSGFGAAGGTPAAALLWPLGALPLPTDWKCEDLSPSIPPLLPPPLPLPSLSVEVRVWGVVGRMDSVVPFCKGWFVVCAAGAAVAGKAVRTASFFAGAK